ncbi:hypothetical protein C5B85_04550 [Pseudoclavibacter sp. AY1F1]|uniref:hypothetical protein n=1 Tax=Pseudoclavibacter sp. AY1F1 TaxID=2080583 RepID=UPI000CE92318|nr:hypothetical protein [Pseudoclavibacter sp. AY1F1]PPF45939.1 hypothetical protein C5B85_04550 [Pseudoclavibacter sp. AY1F1]
MAISRRRQLNVQNQERKSWASAILRTLLAFIALFAFFAIARFLLSSWLPEIDAENLVEESGAGLSVERVPLPLPDGTIPVLPADWPPPQVSGEFVASLDAASRLSLLAKETLTVTLGITLVWLTEWSTRAWLHLTPPGTSQPLRILALLGVPLSGMAISLLFLGFGTSSAIGLWEGEGELVRASVDTSVLTLAASFLVGLGVETYRKRSILRRLSAYNS